MDYMDILLQTYYTVLPIITTSLMGYVIWVLQNNRKKEAFRIEAENKRIEEENRKQQALTEGTRMILLYMLERLYEEYKIQDYVTHEQRDKFHNIYDAYHALGGNGYGTALWETIQELEIRNDADGVSPFVKMLKQMNTEEK